MEFIGRSICFTRYCFLKFNFSHNGGSVTRPIDFPDLGAFAENNYSKELDDLDCIIEMVFNSYKSHIALDVETLILMGHSRGGRDCYN